MIIGGEIEIPDFNHNIYFTDSGRSSLRLLFNTYKPTKLLLPDFLCEVIINIVCEFHINYDFYNVNEDLTIDVKSILTKEYDALYLINYFGRSTENISQLADKNKFIIEDNVFLYNFNKPKNISNWFGFNSYRKITSAMDGSLIKSTLKLDKKLINNNTATFVKYKKKAKNIKYGYLQSNIRNQNYEKRYLELFRHGEKLLSEQREIHMISGDSQNILLELDIYEEKRIRHQNYKCIKNILEKYIIPIKSDIYSFAVLKLDYRNDLKEYLLKKNVFLPIHWPKPIQVDNVLYNKIISIPIDSRYTNKDLISVARHIGNFISYPIADRKIK